MLFAVLHMSLLLTLTMLAILLPLKLSLCQELYSPFKYGFDPNHHFWLLFSLQFFLMSVVYLIFDVEIILFLPLPLITSSISTKFFILPFSTVLLILMKGLMNL